MRQRKTVYFTGPGRAEVRTEPLPDLAPDHVRVRTTCTAISPGTERLIFEGHAPATMKADAAISALQGDLSYPLAYGYCAVGVVDKAGAQVPSHTADELVGQRVFAFQPHTSVFTARPESLTPVPDSLSDEEALLIPSMETAVTLTLDGGPRIGERVVIFGQGLIGLLTTALLSSFPLESLITVEPLTSRRKLSEQFGASHSLDPADGQFDTSLAERLGIDPDRWKREKQPGGGGADLCIEVSGQPDALNQAIYATSFGGKIVLGSWYGNKDMSLDLGGAFHRGRLSITSSQVSTIAAPLSDLWTKQRRTKFVLSKLHDFNISYLPISRFSLSEVEAAFGSTVDDKSGVILPMLTYE